GRDRSDEAHGLLDQLVDTAVRGARPRNVADDPTNSRREMILQKLHGADVAGYDDQAGINLLGEAGQLLGHLLGPLLPEVLGALLVAALRPAAGGGAAQLGVITVPGPDRRDPVLTGPGEGSQIGPDAVGENDDVGHGCLLPLEDRTEAGEGAESAHVPGGWIGLVVDKLDSVGGGHHCQGPAPGMGFRYQWIDGGERFVGGAGVEKVPA